MRYFLDTEFIETGKTIDLVSIALVAEDGREYYAISNEFDISKASQWVLDNVIAKLPVADDLGSDEPASPDDPWKMRARIKQDIIAFIGQDAPEFWGYYADYDWVVFCWLFGSMIDLPGNFPMYCNDLKQEMARAGIEEIPFKPEDEHCALSDARWNRKAYEWLSEADDWPAEADA